MLLFKVNYSYILRISLSPRQAKKISVDAKERIKKLIELYKNLKKIAKLVQIQIKKYYDRKRSKGLALKEGDKVQLLHKNFKSRRLSKKLNYIKLGLFKIAAKILEIIYRLDLLAKMKIYLVQYIVMLELVHGNIEPLAYETDTYRG